MKLSSDGLCPFVDYVFRFRFRNPKTEILVRWLNAKFELDRDRPDKSAKICIQLVTITE